MALNRKEHEDLLYSEVDTLKRCEICGEQFTMSPNVGTENSMAYHIVYDNCYDYGRYVQNKKLYGVIFAYYMLDIKLRKIETWMMKKGLTKLPDNDKETCKV